MISSNKKRKSIVILCIAMGIMLMSGPGMAKAASALWTQNGNFQMSLYQWDLILYDWGWTILGIGGGPTTEVFTYDDANHAYWVSDGVIDLAACDPWSLDTLGRSARVTYGPFEAEGGSYTYPVPPTPLVMAEQDTVTIVAAVSNYGSSNWGGLLVSWTGIKFDAWFEDPYDTGHETMVIEMYFHATGVIGTLGNEYLRDYADGTHDYILKLQALSQYCIMSGDIPGSNFLQLGDFSYGHTVFTIDLKGIWERAASHWGRSSSDELYAIALDVESGRGLGETRAPQAFAEVNQLSVSYSYPTPDGCVAEGTLVTMADGSVKPVEEIEKGDQVLGYDPSTGLYMAENVLKVTKTYVEVIVNFNNGRLRVTPTDQPIFIRNATYEGWVRDPATIQVGWQIYEPKGETWVTVTSMTYEEGKTRVYDLVLDGYQTYFANGILLMDKC